MGERARNAEAAAAAAAALLQQALVTPVPASERGSGAAPRASGADSGVPGTLLVIPQRADTQSGGTGEPQRELRHGRQTEQEEEGVQCQ